MPWNASWADLLERLSAKLRSTWWILAWCRDQSTLTSSISTLACPVLVQIWPFSNHWTKSLHLWLCLICQGQKFCNYIPQSLQLSPFGCFVKYISSSKFLAHYTSSRESWVAFVTLKVPHILTFLQFLQLTSISTPSPAHLNLLLFVHACLTSSCRGTTFWAIIFFVSLS